MTDTKIIHDRLVQVEGEDDDTQNIITLAAEHLLYLEDSCRVKDIKFDTLCKDKDRADEMIKELNRIIANQRAIIEVQEKALDTIERLVRR